MGLTWRSRLRILHFKCCKGLLSAIFTWVLLQGAAAQVSVIDYASLSAAISHGAPAITIAADITLTAPLVVKDSVEISGARLADGKLPRILCNKQTSAFDIRGEVDVSITHVWISGCVGTAIQGRDQAALALNNVVLADHIGSLAGMALNMTQCRQVSLLDCSISGNTASTGPASVNASVVSLVDVPIIQVNNTNFTLNTAPKILKIFVSAPKLLVHDALQGALTVNDEDYSKNFLPKDPFKGGHLIKLSMRNTSFMRNDATDAVMHASNVLLDATFLRFLSNTNTSSQPPTGSTTATNASTTVAATAINGSVLLLQHSGAKLHGLVAVNNTNFFTIVQLKKMFAATQINASTIRENVGHDVVHVDGCNIAQNNDTAVKFRNTVQGLEVRESEGFNSESLFVEFLQQRYGNYSGLRKISYLSALDLAYVYMDNNTATGAVMRVGAATNREHAANLIRFNHVRFSGNIVQPSAFNTCSSDKIWTNDGVDTITPSSVLVLGHAYGTVSHLNLSGNTGSSIMMVLDTNITFTNSVVMDNVALPGPVIGLSQDTFMEHTHNLTVTNNTAACCIIRVQYANIYMYNTVFNHNKDLPGYNPAGLETSLNHSTVSGITAVSAQLVLRGAILKHNRFQYVVTYNFTVAYLEDATFEDNRGGAVFMYTPYPHFEKQPLNISNVTFRRNRLTRGVLGAMTIIANWWRPGYIDRCVFDGNEVVSNGTAAGGLYIGSSVNQQHADKWLTFCCQHEQAFFNVTNNKFSKNNGLQGGGLWMGRPGFIQNNQFLNNVAEAHCHNVLLTAQEYASVYNAYPNATVNHMQLIDPTESAAGSGFGPGLGGAMFLQSAVDPRALTVADNIIIGNEAQYGGGIFVENSCALIRFQAGDRDVIRCNVTLANNTLENNYVVQSVSGAGNAPAVFFVSSRGLDVACKQGSRVCDKECWRNGTCHSACNEWKNNTSVNGTRGAGACGGLGSRVKYVDTFKGNQSRAVYTTPVPAGVNNDFRFRMYDEYMELVEGDLILTQVEPEPSPQLVLVRTKAAGWEGTDYVFSSLQLMPLSTPALQSHYVRFVATNGHKELTGVDYRNEHNISFSMRPCGLGEYLNLRVCMPCASEGAALFSNFYNATCQDCPAHGDNAICQRRGFLVPANGYWQPHMQSPHLHRCPFKSACRYTNRTEQLVDIMTNASQAIMRTVEWNDDTSGRVTPELNALYRQTQCNKAYTGNLCGVCREGYGRLLSSCYECTSGTSNALTFLGVLLVICCTIAITVWCQLSNTHERIAALPHNQRAKMARVLSMYPSTQPPSVPPGMFSAPGMFTARTVESQGLLEGRTSRPSIDIDIVRRRSTYDLLTSPRASGTQPSTGLVDERTRSQVPEGLDSVGTGAMPVLERGVDKVSMTQILGEVTSLFKLLVTYLQGLSCLNRLDIEFPWVNQFYMYSFDAAEFVSVDCLFKGYTSETKAIISTCITMFVPVIVLILSTAFWLVKHAFQKKKRGLYTYIWPRICMTAVQIGYYLHQLSTSAAFNVFTCYRPSNTKEMQRVYKSYTYAYKDESIIFPSPKLGWWTAHYDTVCFRGRHMHLSMIVGLPWILIFSIGVPVAFVYLTWKHRAELTLPVVFIKYGFLYEEYHERFYWWESIIMLRKIMLLAACTLLGAFGLEIQILALLLIIMACSRLQEIHQPFHTTLLNSLEGWSLFLLGVNVAALGFFSLLSYSTASFRKILLILIGLITTAFAFVVVYHIWKLVRILMHEHFDYDGDGKFGWPDLKGASLALVNNLTAPRQRPLRPSTPPTSPPTPQPSNSPTPSPHTTARNNPVRDTHNKKPYAFTTDLQVKRSADIVSGNSSGVHSSGMLQSSHNNSPSRSPRPSPRGTATATGGFRSPFDQWAKTQAPLLGHATSGPSMTPRTPRHSAVSTAQVGQSGESLGRDQSSWQAGDKAGSQGRPGTSRQIPQAVQTRSREPSPQQEGGQATVATSWQLPPPMPTQSREPSPQQAGGQEPARISWQVPPPVPTRSREPSPQQAAGQASARISWQVPPPVPTRSREQSPQQDSDRGVTYTGERMNKDVGRGSPALGSGVSTPVDVGGARGAAREPRPSVRSRSETVSEEDILRTDMLEHI